LLWCVRSQRYSERQPDEFGFELREDWFKGMNFNYTFNRLRLPEDLKLDRPRMATMTEVFGKALVTLKP